MIFYRTQRKRSALVRKERGFIWLLVLFASLSGVSRSSWAEDSRADALFRQGVEAVENNNYEEAARAFSESYRILPRPSTIYNLALCWQELGRAEDEREAWRELLDQYGEEISPEARAEAEGRLQELGAPPLAAPDPPDPAQSEPPTLARLILDSSVDEARVSIDGGTPMPLPQDLELPPGEHELRVTAPDHEPSTQVLTLSEGDRLERTLTPGARLPVCRRSFWRSCWPWIIGGVLLIGAGATLGGVLGSRDEPPPRDWTVRGP